MIFPEDQMEAVILGLRSFIKTFCNKDRSLESNLTGVLCFLHPCMRRTRPHPCLRLIDDIGPL